MCVYLYLYIYATSSLSTHLFFLFVCLFVFSHSSVDGTVRLLSHLVIVNNVSMNI